MPGLPEDFLEARKVLMLSLAARMRGEAVDVAPMPFFPGVYEAPAVGPEESKRLAAAAKRDRLNAQKRAWDAANRPHHSPGRPRKVKDAQD